MSKKVTVTAGELRKMKQENARLRKALQPLINGTYWITGADVERARKALGMEPKP